MAITAAQVKALRDSTGAGMMDAKKALTETDGDMEAAQDWLRTKGLAAAAKKAGRAAAEGLVAVKVEKGHGVAVEVNSETDFVAKNADFQQLVGDITGVAMSVSTVEALSEIEIGGKSVGARVTDAIATIGENLTVRRMVSLKGENVVAYVHGAVNPTMGRIAVLVSVDGDDLDFARQVAMHVAAANPAALDQGSLDPSFVERERSVLTEQARESGKPEQVIEKMIAGRMSKFLAENTLMGQAFVVDPDKSVEQAATDAGVRITGYARLAVGEGVEKKEEDFAAEVAKMTNPD